MGLECTYRIPLELGQIFKKFDSSNYLLEEGALGRLLNQLPPPEN